MSIVIYAAGPDKENNEENDVKEDEKYPEEKNGVEVNSLSPDTPPTQLVDDEEVSVKTEDDWDPMSEDFYNIDNSYGAPEDELGFAIEGYKSKHAVCAFFSNTRETRQSWWPQLTLFSLRLSTSSRPPPSTSPSRMA